MRIPVIYNVRSVAQRPVSTALTALGIGLVVAVFIGMLALANGFRTALVRTGSADNVLVLRRGADTELTSGLPREAAAIVAASPHVERDGRGPLVSPEVFVLVPLAREGGDTNVIFNVVARGINERAWSVRRNIRIVEGRAPQAARAEVCVGRRQVGRMANARVGNVLRFAGRDWAVVCNFTSGGSAFESEIWGENEQFMPVFRGQVYQSITFRLQDPAAFEDAKRALEGDRRMTVDVHRESAFYMAQSALLDRVLRVLAILITGIMALGAVFGAVNTMYAAVSSRRPEIAVLLTLGFHPRSVLASFMLESAIIALAGGVIGCLLALPVNGLVTSTTNWASFNEVAFSFRITPQLLGWGLVFALVMGVVAGFFPARGAARMPVVQALR